MSYIYKLYFIEDENTVYIGKTNNLNRRLSNHKSDLNKHNRTSRKDNWLRKYLELGYKLIIEEVARFDTEQECYDAEQSFIDQFTEEGYIIKNSTTGGLGGYKHTPEALQKISDNAKIDTPARREARLKATEHLRSPDVTQKRIANNVIDKQKRYLVQFPDAHWEVVVNLSQFCSKFDLDDSNLRRSITSKYKHKGYRALHFSESLAGELLKEQQHECT